jgi:hypothetical protein
MELVENPERIAGWLYRIGEMLGGKTAPSEEEEEEGTEEGEGVEEEAVEE